MTTLPLILKNMSENISPKGTQSSKSSFPCRRDARLESKNYFKNTAKKYFLVQTSTFSNPSITFGHPILPKSHFLRLGRPRFLIHWSPDAPGPPPGQAAARPPGRPPAARPPRALPPAARPPRNEFVRRSPASPPYIYKLPINRTAAVMLFADLE